MFIAKCFYICVCVCVCACVRVHMCLCLKKRTERTAKEQRKRSYVRKKAVCYLWREFSPGVSETSASKCVPMCVCDPCRVLNASASVGVCLCGCISLLKLSQTQTHLRDAAVRWTLLSYTCSTVPFSYLLAPAYLSIKSQLKGLC